MLLLEIETKRRSETVWFDVDTRNDRISLLFEECVLSIAVP